MNTTTEQSTNLVDRWNAFRTEHPRARIRDAAHVLGVSEAALLATRCGRDGVTRIGADPRAILGAAAGFGRVMCLTRNEAAVHERRGEFGAPAFFHGMGQVVGPEIDLRIFTEAWRHAFSVIDPTPEGERSSIQVFDPHGDAVHKIFLTPGTAPSAFSELVQNLAAVESTEGFAALPRPPKTGERPDREIDLGAFQRDWLALRDTHEFFGLLKRHGVARRQALRLAPPGSAARLSPEALRPLLERAAAEGLPIMVFVGNAGCIQIHTGPVETVRMVGEEWLNVLDPDFNLHLRLPLVDSVWRVSKPTADGVVTSIEAYDAGGELIVQFFGRRKPGEPELDAWRTLVADLEKGHSLG